MNFLTEDMIKILISLAIGALIGFEREMHNKSAGFRTITLISIGSTLFTILSLQLDQEARVAAQIVSGIGFLGAGVILFSEGKVKGLTTASSIWSAAAIGMAVGLGEFKLAVVVAVLVLTVLQIFVRIDLWLNNHGREIRTYRIGAEEISSLETLDSLLKSLKIQVLQKREYKTPEFYLCEWDTRGALSKQEEFTRQATRNPAILSIDY